MQRLRNSKKTISAASTLVAFFASQHFAHSQVLEEVRVSAKRMDGVDAIVDITVGSGGKSGSIIRQETYIITGVRSKEDYKRCVDKSEMKHAICDMNVHDVHYEYVKNCRYLTTVPTFTVGPVTFGGGGHAQCLAEGTSWRDLSLSVCRVNHTDRRAKCRGGEFDR